MISALRDKSPGQVGADVQQFSEKYISDWERWLNTPEGTRAEVFVKILGKWQAIRPKRLRRLKVKANHSPPYMDDLLESAHPLVQSLQDSSMASFEMPSRVECASLTELWEIFSRLPQRGFASCVGISKAVLLLTDGRIGPAFDSQVRRKLGVPHFSNASEWIEALRGVSSDIRFFENRHGVILPDVVPTRFKRLAYGRLYDMALGPRV